MVDFLNEFGRSFRVSDAADILLVAVAIYFTLIWLKQTASRSVLIGVGVLVGIYFLARAFDLYMTSVLFNAAFAGLVVALVVVFQHDIRRAIERIAVLGRLPRLSRTTTVAPSEIDSLIEAAFTLASDKRGALMVLKGREEIESHVDGGIGLDGRLSKPLLYSIFDPNSAGHDGAVLIDSCAVRKFAAHLPLSHKRSELGTRHSAAVGLSECCDALVIVISEERGVVSVAERGRLEECHSPADLKTRVERFLRKKFPQSSEPAWKTLLKQHFKTKLTALFLACLAWGVVGSTRETIQRTFVVPIEYRKVPENVILKDHVPTETRVTFSGSERAFQFLAPSVLKVSLDLSEAARGKDAFTITDKQVRHPSNLTVYRVEPRAITLTLDQKPDY